MKIKATLDPNEDRPEFLWGWISDRSKKRLYAFSICRLATFWSGHTPQELHQALQYLQGKRRGLTIYNDQVKRKDEIQTDADEEH